MHLYLLFVTWVAYSVGAAAGGIAVPARRRVNPHPSLFETALIAVAVLAAAMARARLAPRLSAVVWCLAWATIAFILRFALARRPISGAGGSGDFVPLPETIAPPHATVLGRAWQSWKSFGHAMADFQGRVVLTLSYFTLVLPLAIGVTLFKDPLGLRRSFTPYGTSGPLLRRLWMEQGGRSSMNILGVSCYYHDSAAALIQNGKLVAASEEERFSRRKHDCGFPTRAIEFCLRFAGIGVRDLDYVVFYEKPFLKLERILFTSLGVFPRSWNIFREASISWMQDRLWVKNRLVESLPVPADRVLFVDHHLAHAASAFFCSPFTEAAILTVDGVGEWSTSTIGRGTAKWNPAGSNSIQLTHELRFPHSLGLLYSAFTGFLGFEVNEGEYKVMGMSCYGQPRYLDRIAKVARVNDDGSLCLDMDYFSYHYSAVRSYNRRFLDLFGPPRDPRSEFLVTGGSSSTAEWERNQYYADVAASIQRFTEDVLLKMACHVHRATGLKQLCMAGGVALNSMANARILRETPFEELFIQPAAGDSGGAVGAALYAWHVLLGHDREFVLENAYLGSSYEEADIAGAIGDTPHQRYDDSSALVERVVQELEAGKVVGWFQGRSEWGPRALGNRSILADPRSSEMKDTINRKIKFREPFRPFAPVVAEQDASRFFDGVSDFARQYPARYMLLVLPWKPGAAEAVPAVNHMGTGRLQTLRREWNPLYYDILVQFGQATGTPVLLNTSFNLRGEPIVCSPVDACRTFRNSGLDLLVLNNFVVVK